MNKGIFALLIVSVLANTVTVETSIFVDLVEGFMKGVNGKQEFVNIQACLGYAKTTLLDLETACKLISTLVPADLIKGMALLGTSLRKLINQMKDCKSAYPEYEFLVESINKLNVFHVLTSLLKDIDNFKKYISRIIIAILNHNDYIEGGKAIGEAIYRIIFEYVKISTENDFNLYFLFDFIEGFFEGLGHGTLFNNTEACIAGFPNAIEGVMKVIEVIKQIDIRDPDSLRKVVQELSKLFSQIGLSLMSCVKTPMELKYIVMKVINMNGSKLYERVIAYQLQLMNDIGMIFKYLAELNFRYSGKSAGDIPYLLIIKDD